jgi:hypothetical protein
MYPLQNRNVAYYKSKKTIREINADETDVLFRLETLCLQVSAGLQVSLSLQVWANPAFPGSHIG